MNPSEDDVERIRQHARSQAQYGRFGIVVRLHEAEGFRLEGTPDRVSAAAVLIALTRGYLYRLTTSTYGCGFLNGGAILAAAAPKAAYLRPALVRTS